MTDFEYQPLPEDLEDEYDAMLRYAFSAEDGPIDDEGSDGDEDDGPDLGRKRGVFEGDELVAVCRQYYWPTTVRGEDLSLGGLSAVASPPENRRRGAVADMIAGSLAEYHEEGCEFAALWPFDRSFYARYGYATANCFATLEIPVEKLAFAEEYEAGGFRSVAPDEWATLDAVYEEFVSGRSLPIDRGERWWTEKVFSSHRGDPFVYGYERDGQLAGYLVYTVDEEDDETVLWATELAWRDDEAFLNLLRFAYYHDSQVDTVRFRGPSESQLRDVIDHVPDSGYENVDYQLWPGLMVRIVDVPEALESIGYPEGVDERVRIGVSDDVVKHNDGTFRLEVVDGTARCVPTDERPEVECSIGTLSQAAVGYRPVERLAQTGDLQASGTALDGLATLFPETAVYLGDIF
jgi:predicted acetyltransferase